MATFIQVAFGGYWTIPENPPVYSDANIFYEPGFNIMSPVEFVSPEANYLFILVRKVLDRYDPYWRGPVYEYFLDSLNESPFIVSVTDVTTNTVVPSTLEPNNYNVNWNNEDEYSYPLILRIVSTTNQDTLAYRFRAMDVVIRDTRDERFIKFRITINDSSEPFGFLTIDKTNKEGRPSSSAFGTSTLLPLSYAGTYTVVMPFSSFSETTKELAKFSYPTNEIYYGAEDVINREPMTFSLGNVSHTMIRDYVRVMPVPQYSHGAVIETDADLRTTLADLGEQAWFEVNSISELSQSVDKLKFYLVRATGIEYL